MMAVECIVARVDYSPSATDEINAKLFLDDSFFESFYSSTTAKKDFFPLQFEM